MGLPEASDDGLQWGFGRGLGKDISLREKPPWERHWAAGGEDPHPEETR